jgi:hypothetical protein
VDQPILDGQPAANTTHRQCHKVRYGSGSPRFSDCGAFGGKRSLRFRWHRVDTTRVAVSVFAAAAFRLAI